MGTDDLFSYRMVVAVLGLLAILGVLGTVVLEATDNAPASAEWMRLTATACIGILAGLLARPPKANP